MSARVSRAIDVLVYELADGTFYATLIEKKWHGRQQWLRRLGRPVRIIAPDPCPPGVTPEYWEAYSALRALVTEQVLEYRNGPPTSR